MKPLRLLIAVALLAAVGIALWLSNRDEKAKEGKPAADAPPQILAIPPDQVKAIELKHRGEAAIDAVFDDKGKWQITSPEKLPADVTTIAQITNMASRLNSERMVDANATDLATYGLAPALIEVSITDKAGKKSKLLIGETTPVGGNVYAKLDGDPRLFTIAANSKIAFDKELKDLRDKSIFTFTQDKVTQVDLTAKGETIGFSKIGDGEWKITKPKMLRADGVQVEDMLTHLHGASLDTAASDDDPKLAAAAFNAGTLVGDATVTDESGAHTIEVRKNKDDYYVKSSTADRIYKAIPAVADAMKKSLNDFRAQKMFDFDFNEPSRIAVTDGAKTSLFSKNSDKWTSAGKTMDTTSVQQLIDKLRDLASSKYVDAGFTPPAVTISVTSGQAKRQEKVEISQAGDGFLGRHDGDAGVYQLDPKAVKDLRQAVGDVREEQKAAPKK